MEAAISHRFAKNAQDGFVIPRTLQELIAGVAGHRVQLKPGAHSGKRSST